MVVDCSPPADAVDAAVRRALTEDLTPLGDITSALLDPAVTTMARFVARDHGVLAGTACARRTFDLVNSAITMQWHHNDGALLQPGDVIATVSGPLHSILTAERTALNFMSHLSGVASLTHRYVEAAAAGGPARIWDTRKTIPGLRSLEKAAVRAGGGANHRGNLSDWVMVKDNHLLGAPIAELVTRARSAWPGRTVHVECDTITQVGEAVDAGADALLLDNMDPSLVARCVAVVAERCGSGRRPLVEASGGITLDNVAGYAAAGVDCISVGAITNAAGVLDIGLDIAAPTP
jgi:nicotinate-nucleotide pyrophosphorylase (carboxylating)